MPEELEIRRCRPADADRIRELHEVALRDAGGYVEDGPDADLTAPHATYIEQGGDFLVGELAGQIVAMGGFRPASEWIADAVSDLATPAAELKRMRVDPAYQRRGFGTVILRRLEERARDAGFREVVLDTGADFDAPRSFYESSGIEHERNLTVDVGDSSFEMALYRKRLDARQH